MTRPLGRRNIFGLRFARWIRESTKGQHDRYGPASQHANIDAFAAEYGLVDTGLVWSATHSGKNVWNTNEMRAAIEAARQGGYDLLIIGWFDRFGRNQRRFLDLVEDGLHGNDTALVMADHGLVSSIPGDWRQMRDNAARAEDWLADHKAKSQNTWAARKAEYHDPGGQPPHGIARDTEKPFLEHYVDADMELVEHLWHRYLTENISDKTLARDKGLAEKFVRGILRQPAYAGYMRIYEYSDRRRPDGTEYRHKHDTGEIEPIPHLLPHARMTLDVWRTIQNKRAGKAHGGSPRRNPDRIHPLAAQLVCVDCDHKYRYWGVDRASGRSRRYHERCAPGRKQFFDAERLIAPLAAQLSALTIKDPDLKDDLANALAQPPAAPEPDLSLLRKRLRERFDGGELSAQDFVTQSEALRPGAGEPAAAPRGMTVDRALAYLSDFSSTWAAAPADKRAQLLDATYASVKMRGDQIIEATLTDDAEQYGMALALPQSGVGSGKPDPSGGALPTLFHVPITQRDAWIRAARRSA